MATGFDILGVLSFVQDVITVVAAAILTFIAAAEQFRDNKSAIYDVTQQINRIDVMFPPAPSGRYPRAVRLASETAEMRLILKISEVVNQAHQRDFQLLRHQISKLERLKLKSSFLEPPIVLGNGPSPPRIQ
ncbi:hypothetical protein C8R44DRAFT_894677 [Mycena epipterygia]|nr:hypothetical protein C8R44DRAFT_894677 [Mycena epipterygia]